MFPAAPSPNLTYGIVQKLGIAIVSGSYSNSNPFPVEADLCRQFGVSRSVLREAVKMLTAKGLLGARPRHGTWVQPEDHWNTLDPDVLRWLLEHRYSPGLLVEFTQMRLAVEPAAAALAARSATDRDKATIVAALRRMESAAQGDDDPLESDIAFHVAILHASRNRFYMQMRDLITSALRFSIRTTNKFKGVRLGDVEDHSRICDAILASDPERASQLMKSLLEEVINLLELGNTAPIEPVAEA